MLFFNSSQPCRYGAPTQRNWISNFYRQCKLAGPQHREFRKEILQTMQVGWATIKKRLRHKVFVLWETD
ncbi:hypothetical protein CD116_10420 [Staphylococcus schweitzeri]|uniref:Uncharacterized protein n=1 Tax=Staphylococcus schweitzeri TaxID=1654388 RepID=A0A2K4AF39_9STAP|nr:hypothetical protein CD116_10420 [Staphylococcus schweitzeri]